MLGCTEAFEENMKRLTATLKEQCAKTARLDKAIWPNVKELGFAELPIGGPS